MTMEELSRLRDLPGTFIAEFNGNHPFRVWWTPDDLSALGAPPKFPDEMDIVFGPEGHPFNTRVVFDYIDDDDGKAFLTPMSSSTIKKGRFEIDFPEACVVNVWRHTQSTEKNSASNHNRNVP